MRPAMIAASFAALLLPLAGAADARPGNRVLVFVPAADYAVRDAETRSAYLKRLRGEARSLCAGLERDGQRVCEDAVTARAKAKIGQPRVIVASAD